MSKVCQLTGKKTTTGNNRSHSLRATKRKFRANVSKKSIIDPFTGEKITAKISTSAQRTLLKNPKKFKKELAKLVAAKKKRAQ